MSNNRLIFEVFLASLLVSLGWHFSSSLQFMYFLRAIPLVLFAVVFCRGLFLANKGIWRVRLPRELTVKQRIAAWLGFANMTAFIALSSVAYVTTLATIQFHKAAYWWEIAMIAGAALAAAMGLFFTRCRPFPFWLQVPAILGSLALTAELWRANTPPSIQESVILHAPTAEPFFTLNGGNSRLENSHMARVPPRYLGAFLMTGQTFGEAGKTAPADRAAYSFGKLILAPASGVIEEAVSHLPDTDWDVSDELNPLGNHVIIRIAPERYLLLGNLMQNSLLAAKGDTVKAGQPLARLGHSGVLSEPMLTVAVLDSPEAFNPDSRSIPFYFTDVMKKDDNSAQTVYFPRRNDIFIPQ